MHRDTDGRGRIGKVFQNLRQPGLGEGCQRFYKKEEERMGKMNSVRNFKIRTSTVILILILLHQALSRNLVSLFVQNTLAVKCIYILLKLLLSVGGGVDTGQD